MREPSSQPEPDPTAPKMRQLSVEQFLTMCHDPRPNGLRAGLDRHLDEIQAKGPIDDRSMLRVCFWLLSNIGRSMPWNSLDGLDTVTFNPETNVLAPSWRECIGSILGLTYQMPHPNPEEDLNEEDVPDEQVEEQEG